MKRQPLWPAVICIKTMDIRKEFEIWKENTKDDSYMQTELAKIESSEEEMMECFGGDLGFGTSGIRGLLGPGPRRINKYVVARATQGLSDYINSNSGEGKVVIAYDSRHQSHEFALETARVLSGNNIRAYLFNEVTPVPVLSFSIEELSCDYGIMITASHNAGIFNGYKVYNKYGYQVVGDEPDEILDKILNHSFFDDIKRSEENIEYLSDDIKEAFIKKVGDITAAFNKKEDSPELKIVYTPLNGAGNEYIKRVLGNAGFESIYTVPSQEEFDPDFTTCKSPNPEKLSAYSEAFRVLDKVGADIIIASDPDSDRVGVALIHEGTKINLTGNQIGLLMLDHLCTINPPADGKNCYRSIVSTPLIDRLAEANGLNTVTTLTGFKYIGETIENLIKEGREEDYYFAFEESNGFLVSPFIRDKDAISSALIIASMASYQKKRGQDLIDHLDEIYGDFGTLIDKSKSFNFEGLAGQETMNNIMTYLREEIDDHIGDLYVEERTDYLHDDTGLPPSNIIKFEMDDGSTVIVRPSGTEPKIKVYMFLTDPTSTIDKGITDIMDSYK